MGEENEKSPGQSDFLSLVQICATLGCTLLVATMGTMVFHAPALGAGHASTGGAGSLALAALGAPGCFLLGFAVIHLVSYLRPGIMRLGSGEAGRLATAIGTLFGSGMLASLVPWAMQPWHAVGVTIGNAVAGAAAGALMLRWGHVWSMVGHEENGAVFVARNTAISTALAAALAVMLMFAPHEVAALCLAAMIAGSCALNASCMRRLARNESDADAASEETTAHRRSQHAGNDEGAQSSSLPDAEPDHRVTKGGGKPEPTSFPRPRPRLITRAAFTSLTTGLAFGAVFGLITLSLDAERALLTVAAASLAATVCSLGVMKLSGIPRVPGLEHAVFLVVGPALLVWHMLPGILGTVALCAACAALVLYYIFNPNTLNAVSFSDRSLSSYHCARENVVSLVSTLVSWGAVMTLTAAGLPLSAIAGGIALSCVATMLAEPLFTPYMSNRAIDQLITLDERPDDEDQSEQTQAARAQLEWRKRCVDICRSCELSPRETEVFMLLARGRNSAHIAESLVISPHTARTHIYRIYQKTGVSSHQELLDLIERV